MIDARRVAMRFLVATENTLSPEMERSVSIVENFLKGSKKAKFQASIDVLRASLQHGSWIPRGKVKAGSGFYQGLADLSKQPYFGASFKLQQCLSFGQPYWGDEVPVLKTVPEPVVRAWIHCTQELSRVSKLLDAARPKPVITQVGLSPKVTKTLTEMDLDIDLSTVREADLVRKEHQDVDKHGQPRFTRDGEPIMISYFVVKWTPGIKLNKSRFSGTGGCEACGRPIPSRQFVPIEALCSKQGLVGFWVGVDCAKNIFGIKDQGIDRVEVP
jgi:hypothetical protein